MDVQKLNFVDLLRLITQALETVQSIIIMLKM